MRTGRVLLAAGALAAAAACLLPRAPWPGAGDAGKERCFEVGADGSLRRRIALAMLMLDLTACRTDLVMHGVWSAHVGCLGAGVLGHLGARTDRSAVLGAAAALAAGLAKEGADSGGGTGFDWLDLAADAAGAAAGAFLFMAVED